MRFQVVAIFLAGLVMSGCVNPSGMGANAALTPLPSGSRVVMLEPLAHPENSYAARDLADFKADQGRGYFGAFAVSDAGMPAHVTGYHDRADAAAEAIFWCRKNGGDRSCKVIAERVPLAAMPKGAVTLSERATAVFRDYQTKTGPKAFAIGKVGAFSAEFSGQTLDEVRNEALRNCNKENRGGKPTPSNCRIVDAQN